RSRTLKPSACALAMRRASSSKTTTSAPPASSATAVASPEPPSPKTATRAPSNIVIGIIRSTSLPPRSALRPVPLSQLQRCQPGERQHHRDDPEADDDLRLGPSQLFKVVMDRRHLEHPLAGQ